jgi:hypothetical protein
MPLSKGLRDFRKIKLLVFAVLQGVPHHVLDMTLPTQGVHILLGTRKVSRLQCKFLFVV